MPAHPIRAPLLERFPATAGTYALILVLDRRRQLRVGRLGHIAFEAGAYAYAGSAFGPGGLRARIGRHLDGDPRQPAHWHIDYLKRAGRIVEVWHATGSRRAEHAWAAALATLRGASTPVRKFGSSDCRCGAHLVRFPGIPHAGVFGRVLASRGWCSLTDVRQRVMRTTLA